MRIQRRKVYRIWGSGSATGRALAGLVFAAGLCLVPQPASSTQALPAVPAVVQAPAASAWIGREDEMEAHLRDAKVVRIEEIATGVTRPKRIFLDPPEPFDSLVWKMLPPGRRQGYWESYKAEIAAYELDKLLRMHTVPPAVERTISGETGAAIMWLPSLRSVKENGGRMPAGVIWGQASRRMVTFDNFIGNPDRNAGNILIGAPGELLLIDHSRAFETEKRLPRKVERVDAELWTRIEAITRDDLDRVLGRWLPAPAIDAMLERRSRMAADIAKLSAKKGKALVVVD